MGCGFFMFLRSPLILDQALLCESMQGLLAGRLVASVVLGLLSGKRGAIGKIGVELVLYGGFLKGHPHSHGPMGFNIKKV